MVTVLFNRALGLLLVGVKRLQSTYFHRVSLKKLVKYNSSIYSRLIQVTSSFQDFRPK